MFLRDFLDMVSKEKRKRDRANAVQKFAAGMGAAAALGVAAGFLFAPQSGKETREDLMKRAIDTVETIRNTVRKKAETVKDSATHAVQEVSHVIKNIHGKTEGVKKDMIYDCHDIAQDIEKTTENISNELNKPIK